MNDFSILPRKMIKIKNLSRFNEQINALFSSICKIVCDRYDAVYEDVREHRVVFGKKTPLRWFLDALPMNEGVMLSIRSPQKHPSGIVKIIIHDMNDLEGMLPSIDAAYQSV